MPPSTTIVYASLFIIAFYFYAAVWSSAPITASDTGGYFGAAHDLSDFSINRLQQRAPGYPLFLLLTGADRSSRSPFLVSLLLHFASIWLLAVVLYRVGLGHVELILFSLILLLPPFVEPAGYLLSENLAEVMLVTAFVSLILWHMNKSIGWLFTSGISIGYAALTRPTYQLLSLAIIGYFFLTRLVVPRVVISWKNVITASLVLSFTSIIIIGGYAYLNYRSVGYFGITPKLGLTLSIKTLRVLERLPDEYAAVREFLIKARNAEMVTSKEHTGYMYIWGTEAELTRITGIDQPELSNYMLKLNLVLIRQAPLTFLQEVLWAFGSYWLPSSTELANFNSRYAQLLWAIIHFCLVGAFVVNLILLLGALTYVKNCKKVLKEATALLFINESKMLHLQGVIYGLAASIVFYTAAVSCLIEVGTPRYRVPTDILIVFMVFLGTHLWQRLSALSTIVIGERQA